MPDAAFAGGGRNSHSWIWILHLTEAQEHLYLDKERKRFRALALKMLEAGEIPAVPECLEHANTRAQFTLIPETFGDLLSEAAQLVTWMCNLSLPLKELGRHAGKYAEGEKTEGKGGFSIGHWWGRARSS